MILQKRKKFDVQDIFSGKYILDIELLYFL